MKIKSFIFFIIFFPILLLAEEDSTEYEEDPYASISYMSIDEIEPRNFDSIFKSRYRADEFQYEPRIKHYSQWEQFKQWIVNWLRKIFDAQNEQQASDWFDYLVNFLAISLVLLVGYFIVKAVINKEGRWLWSRSEEEQVIEYKDIEQKIHQIDFSTLIAKSKQQGNYRLMIRYYYLWLLKKLSDKKKIEWDVNKTNSDYLYEIKDKNLRDKFAYNCYIYDYIWYGEFELEEQMYWQAEAKFKETLGLVE